MNDCIITLISKIPTQERNSIGEVKYNEIRTEVMACDVPVSRQESFYAQQIGFRVEHEFIVNPLEYQGQGLLEFNGGIFEVYRTYEASSNELELYCRKALGGGK